MHIVGRKNTKSIIFNYIGTIIPILTLQLFVLPKVNAALSDESYGLIITLISLVTMIADAAGNSLNNVRLISDVEYTEKGYSGDFNYILAVITTPTVIAIMVLSVVLMNGALTSELIGVFVMSLLFSTVCYYKAGFLIHLDYFNLMVGNLLQAVGYVVGYYLFTQTSYWCWIYIVGYGANLVYILLKTDLLKEGCKRTPLFKSTSKKEAVLFFVSLLGGSVAYFDKLMLYPMLGGSYVTIYYVANLFGKMITTAMNPLSSFILSFFSRKRTLKRKTVKSMLLVSIISGILGYLICLVLSRPILEWLYPNVASESMKYISITLLTAVIDMQYYVLSPIIIRFYKITWQLIIYGVNIVVYVTLSLIMLSLWGIMGFCIGVCIAAGIKFLMVLIIYLKSKTNANTESIEEDVLK